VQHRRGRMASLPGPPTRSLPDHRAGSGQALDALVLAVLVIAVAAPGEHELHALAVREAQALDRKAVRAHLARDRMARTRRPVAVKREHERAGQPPPAGTRLVVIGDDEDRA